MTSTRSRRQKRPSHKAAGEQDTLTYAQKLARTQVDLVKMEEGGLDAAFLIVYVGQSPQLDSAAVAALPEVQRNAYLSRQEDITARRYPQETPATVKEFVDHVDYAVKLIGIDHIGIASDFDGGGG